MKHLFCSLLLFCITHVIGSESVTVQYDENYYSPVATVSKWDFIHPLRPQNYNIRIRLKKNGVGTIFDRTFKSDCQSVYFYYENPANSISIHSSGLGKARIGLAVKSKSKIKNCSFLITYQDICATIHKKVACKKNQEMIIMDLKSRFKTDRNITKPGIIKKYTLATGVKSKKDSNLILSITVTAGAAEYKNIKTDSQKTDDKEILEANVLKCNTQLATNKELLAYHKEISSIRDIALKKYSMNSISLKTLNIVQKKYIEVNKAVSNQKKSIENKQ